MKLLVMILTMILSGTAVAGLLINEAVTETESDWVEITLRESGDECRDVSGLYVTMYYGTNEKLADTPVTICSYDNMDTPYDDRYIVVHLTEPGKDDETDETGDSNGNGYLDVYCNNYSNSLWNSDGVIAIDTDDDPSTGGMIDFIAYSNRDQTPNSVIEQYVASAQEHGHWESCAGRSIQECSVYTGEDGLSQWASIARKNSPDSNSSDDFSVTRYVTPGRDNVFSAEKKGRKLFRALKKKIVISKKSLKTGELAIPVFVFKACSLRYRIFSLTGICLHRSSLIKDLAPGSHRLDVSKIFKKKSYPLGLYICSIEASSKEARLSEDDTAYVILAGK
ncbi:MAG TPA: hypothetical protein PK926_05735 [Spirochaetota bacterium]|nr:hypothetical protein [Spirochaetota bacterium]HPI87735.1 hypothetical protein [Spirochaetota bacterium]HPR48140.1 hypothetical protein [Spirochaetota bacterium]